MKYQTFDEWKNSSDYQDLITYPFGDFGYVEAIAEIAWRASRENTESEVYEKMLK